MKFTKLEDAAKKPLDVTVLDLSGWVTTADLVQFPNLILLRIDNGVLELSDKVKLPQLEDLLLVSNSDVSYKRLAFLPLVFPNLLSLHMEYIVNAKEIGEHLSEFKRLEKLIINHGRLTDLSFLANVPKTLNYLDVGANHLDKIQDVIGRLKNLESLYAPLNLIKNVSSKLAILPKLRTLNLSNNLLKRLPRMNKLGNLFTLELSNNKFENLPKSLAKCQQLHELFISNNYLKKLPPEICNMPRLRILSVHSCQLKSLPRNFKRLQSLRHLGLGENLFQIFPSSICEISKLERLNFANNQLRKIPNTIQKLVELRRLDIGGNSIKEVPLVFGKLRKLSELNLERNPYSGFHRALITLPKTEVKGIPRKKFLRSFRKATSEELQNAPEKILAAYDLISNKKRLKISIETLVDLTHICMPALQRKVRKELVHKARKKQRALEIKEGDKLALIGNQSTEFQILISSFIETIEDYEKANLLIIGNEISQEKSKIIKQNGAKILTEKEFLNQFFKLNPPYLISEENQVSVKNLEELFQSSAIENKQIALNAMTIGGVPQSLKMPLIFLSISQAMSDNPMPEAEKLCALFLSPVELDAVEYFWGFYFGKYSLPSQPSLEKLKELCEKANFSYEDFNAFWVGQNDLSW